MPRAIHPDIASKSNVRHTMCRAVNSLSNNHNVNYALPAAANDRPAFAEFNDPRLSGKSANWQNDRFNA